MPYPSFLIHCLLFLAAVAVELVFLVEFVRRELSETHHISENVVGSADFAGGAQKVTACILWTGEVAVLSFKLESAGLTVWWVFVLFGEDS